MLENVSLVAALGGLMVFSLIASMEYVWDYIKRETGLTFKQWLQLVTFGFAQVGEVKMDEWKSSLPLYAFMCPDHRLQYSTPTGYSGRLICKKCLEASK